MKIKELSAKPKLIPITIDSEDIVKEFGESIEFFTWDRQPLDVFLKLASTNGSDYGEMVKVLKTMILDEDGAEVIKDDFMLPTRVLVAAMSKLTDQLGN